MKITIDEQGNVEPRGAANLLAAVNQAVSVPEGGDIPKTPVSVRAFQCATCNESFEAQAGQVTVHECAESDE
jgi:hypothetical protein